MKAVTSTTVGETLNPKHQILNKRKEELNSFQLNTNDQNSLGL
jgi:hypothetical protein